MGATERWLGRVAKSTARTYQNRLSGFLAWLKEDGGTFASMSPDELVAYQINSDNGSRYKLLDSVQEYVDSLDLRYASKQTTYRAIKSFFAHNRAELPNDPHYKIRSDKEPVKTTLTLQDVKDVLLSSNKTYRAIFLSMLQAGMDLSAFEYWNSNGWESLKKQLRGDPEIIKVDLPGRKRRRNKQGYNTFIGMDAIKAIRDYLDAGKRPDGPGPIFWNNNRPVKAERAQHYWLQHLIRLGKVKKDPDGSNSTRYGKNIHELRDLFRSQWEKSPAKGVVAEFMMGHAIDPLGYNKAHMDESWVHKEFSHAVPLLNIMSSDRPFGKVDEDEIEKLRSENEELRKRLEKQLDEEIVYRRKTEERLDKLEALK